MRRELSSRTTGGFTLIELMIVMVIVGILAAIAYPSYRKHVQKTRRADCEVALLGLANAMERHFTETNKYCGTSVAGTCGSGTGSTRAPSTSIYSQGCPVDAKSSADYSYNLRIASNTTTTYTIEAIPVSGGSQADDPCGTLTLDQAASKSVTNQPSGSSYTAAECWAQ